MTTEKPAIDSRLSDGHRVREACAADDTTVSEILGSAFRDDPVLHWLCDREPLFAAMFRADIDALYRRQGTVLMNANHTGAALWLPPGISASAPFHWHTAVLMLRLVLAGGVNSLKRADVLEKIMHANHPVQPHFYLHAIGAKMGEQGKGVGSALLKAGLHACDQQQMPAYLESSNERNNPLYQRFGFELIGEERLPEGGPKLWFMYRAPRLSV